MSETRVPNGFTPGPLMAELPLDDMEAFRLASFGIEYVPQYAPVVMDRDCSVNTIYRFNGQLRFRGRVDAR